VTIFFPLLYLIMGWFIGKTTLDIKTVASWWLTKVIIPFVIVFNIATHFNAMGTVIIATAISMLIMLYIGRRMTNDPVMNLCFSYLNIGWLGLPVASALFGNGAALIVVAAYVGSSIVGNSVGAGLLSGNGFNLSKIVRTPPVLALLAGILLIPFSQQIAQACDEMYAAAKFLMSFLGMAILGIWLAKSKINAADFRLEVAPFIQRSGVLFLLISLLLLLARLCHQSLITDNAATLYLFCLLPPAANIIVLETHYLGSGRSARAISCGTCISIIAIALYAFVIMASRLI